jgi:hypothetical protein
MKNEHVHPFANTCVPRGRRSFTDTDNPPGPGRVMDNKAIHAFPTRWKYGEHSRERGPAAMRLLSLNRVSGFVIMFNGFMVWQGRKSAHSLTSLVHRTLSHSCKEGSISFMYMCHW